MSYMHTVDCQAIDEKIDEYDMRTQINFKLGLITRNMEEFNRLVDRSPQPMQDSYRTLIQASFQRILDETDSLAAYFTDSVNGVRNPGLALPAFSTFVSTQYLPIFILQHKNYGQIYGAVGDISAALEAIAWKSADALRQCEESFNKTTASTMAKRLDKISQPVFYCDDGRMGYQFKDESTGYDFKNIYGSYECGPSSKEGSPGRNMLKKYIDDMRRLVFSRYLAGMMMMMMTTVVLPPFGC